MLVSKYNLFKEKFENEKGAASEHGILQSKPMLVILLFNGDTFLLTSKIKIHNPIRH